MENNENIVEQSNIDIDSQNAIENCDTGDNQSVNDSTLGKFKSKEALLSAYNNLQVEFTKKSQRLSELTKTQENATNTDTTIVDNVPSTPTYSGEVWQERLGKFLKENENAKHYAKEISEIILSDKDIAQDEHALDMAYLKVLKSKSVPYEDLIKTDEFYDKYISNNNDIKQKILKEYISSVKKSPNVIRGDGGSSQINGNTRPTTMSEAKEMAKALFRV